MPTKTTVVSTSLQNVSLQFKPPGLIGYDIFPTIDNVPIDAKIGKYERGAWFRNEAGVRPPGAEARRGTYMTSEIPIETETVAFASELTDEEVRIAGEQGQHPFEPKSDTIEYATYKVDLYNEIKIANAVKNWTNSVDVAGTWAAGTGNTTIADIETQMEAFRVASGGLLPNNMMVTKNVVSQWKQEASFIERIKYTEKGIFSLDLIAALFDLDKIHVAQSIYSNAKETKAGTDWNPIDVWDKNPGKGTVFLYYRPQSPGLRQTTAGYYLRRKLSNGKSREVLQWREESKHQDVYEVSENSGIKVIEPTLGILFYDCIQD